ncbi:5-formyltetrahydrofolate cyclo-ligase-like [Babylonia areolata]|uniref:5-formyltetrahydrofolate cyclo-ligase-like n=1 Tax=Babylonia areolata TaxID=304850 RepID=UPI003FCF9B58
MATMQQAKATLRKEIKKRLALLSPEEKKRQSEIVISKVLASPWFQDCRRLSVFLSMSDEVDTAPLVRATLAAGKECFIPHYKGATMTMVPLRSMEDYDRLPLTKWNIKQPADDHGLPDALETGGLDVIFMPGLAFTHQGARLGRGKGYYDSYLTRCQQAGVMPVTVALIFAQQIVDYVPLGEHDVLVNHVLSSA